MPKLPEPTGKWRVQDGYERSAYEDRWTFPADKRTQAMKWYNGLNTGNGYKKRLIDPNGKIVARYLS